MNEKKYFSGWASCMHWIGVLCVIAAIPIALVSGLTKVALAVEVASSGLGLVLASAVLDWMDDLLDNVRRIRAHSAQSASEMETVNARLRRAEEDRHVEAIVRAAQRTDTSTKEPTEAQQAREAAAEKPHPSGPKMYDAKAVAEMYRRSQGGSNPARDFIDGK